MRNNHTPVRFSRGALFGALVAVTVLGAITETGPLLLGGKNADAVIGRPLTPMSYAGVARRTTRRAAYAGAYAGAYAAPVYSSTTVVSAPPSGCSQTVAGGTTVYQCGGGVNYAPSYNGTTVVYRRY
jgi:hypothetical protein